MDFWAIVEKKVKSAAALSLLASFVIALLNALVGDSQLMGSMPAWLQFLIVTLAPPVLAFLGGYATSHTAPSLMKYLTTDGRDLLGQLVYAGYGVATGGKPLLTWEQLGATTQEAWRSGAGKVLDEIRSKM